jgi:diguanylate cyclase (GGDEF)-like protein
LNKKVHHTPSREIFLLFLLVYAVFVSGFVFFTYAEQKQSTFGEADKELTLAARSLKYMLPTDFHDRVLDENSISLEEELETRRRLSSYAMETPFVYLYTLIEKDGALFFATTTVTEEEAEARSRWYFYPYEDAPDAFREAFHTKKTVHETYTDQWGTFRSVAIPERSPGGRTYLACADLEISHLNAIIARKTFRAFVTAVVFLFLAMPFFLIYQNQYKTIKRANAEMAHYQKQLEELVSARTVDLEKATASLREQATRDFLTGLYNRGFIMDSLTEHMTRGKLHGVPLSLMMIDVDNFKLMNDLRGHIFGDSLLKKIGELLRNNTRSVDIVGRFGGDEFVVLLPGIALEGATLIAERLCRRLQEQRIEEEGHALTLSIGLTEQRPHETPTDLLHRADLLLYEAKRRGGNCAVSGRNDLT